LQEVSVTADRERETPTHASIIPTTSDKAHSANAFDLISTMRISGIKVNMQDKLVINNVGQAVVMCINGVEATADEVETLRSKNVISMELQRNPSGKYAGTGGVKAPFQTPCMGCFNTPCMGYHHTPYMGCKPTPNMRYFRPSHIPIFSTIISPSAYLARASRRFSFVFIAAEEENSCGLHLYGKDFLILQPLIKKPFAYVT